VDIRVLHFPPRGPALPHHDPLTDPGSGWLWIDVDADSDDTSQLTSLTQTMGLDPLAVRDAIEDVDLPKVDDFGESLLVIMHALGDERGETYELDCFLTSNRLVTVHRRRSPSIEAVWHAAQTRSDIAAGGPDEMLARLADVVTRRLLSVLEVFESRNDDLIDLALTADTGFLSELTAVRADLSVLRRAVHPQRECFDELRRSPSPLLSDAGRRRFSDVFDAASRAAQGVDAARTALSETLDAYRGAEARQATNVSMVLTIYAAIMLPLSLVAGFFGMNFSNLPLIDDDEGWVIVTVAMALIALVSLGVFITLGWVRRPSGRRAGETLGRGLIEAARAPVQLVGALYEISTLPVRGVRGRRPPSAD